MDIIPKNERRSIKDLQTIPDSYIVLPTTAIHEHVYHLLENDYDGLVKPFLIKKKEGNTHFLKFGLYKDGKILMEPAFDIIIGIHQNRYMPSFHNIYNMRQFGIRLEQRELFSILNTIPLNSLRFVIEETIGSKCSDEVH